MTNVENNTTKNEVKPKLDHKSKHLSFSILISRILNMKEEKPNSPITRAKPKLKIEEVIIIVKNISK